MTYPTCTVEIAAALEEFTQESQAEGSTVCVTFKWKENKKVWAQLLGHELNMGIFTYETEAGLTKFIKEHGLPVAKVEYEKGEYLTATLGEWESEDLVQCIAAIMNRKSTSEVRLDIAFEKF